MIAKIISGGQTGADRAALDVAMSLGIPHGGWVPRGRLTEAGVLPDKYVMDETISADYAERTERNVTDSDGTLIVAFGRLAGGSAYTRLMAEKHGKPWLHVDPDAQDETSAVEIVFGWLEAGQIKVLNVAGPRASEDARIYEVTGRLLRLVQERAGGETAKFAE